MINRGFSRARPPADLDLERERIVQEFIDLWAKGFVDAGVSPEKLYSHTAFVSRRAFKIGGEKKITYSQQNHFAPPSAAFGAHHRPGFSTYPQPGMFDEIHAELAKHTQSGWASSEGTNLQLGSGPGQSGMTMETYLAKMFNHGATVVNIFSWGIGGEANKNMSFRVVTEGEEALGAYRKFLNGGGLIEAAADGPTLMERLPTKIHKIQDQLPQWMPRAAATNKAAALKVADLMKKLDGRMKAKDFAEAEKAVDSILEIIDAPAKPATRGVSDESSKQLRHEFGRSFLVLRDKIQDELKLTPDQRAKVDRLARELAADARPFFDGMKKMTPREREQARGAYRAKALDKLTSALNDVLELPQRTRLRELVHQREGLFDGAEVWQELKVDDEQRQRFMTAIQQMQRQIEPILEGAKRGGNPAEIQRKVLKLRSELETKLEDLLTDAQRTQWKAMLGRPIEVDALFDLTPP